jgi:hypothetical protein
MDILLVPIWLDALFVASETMVTESFADFSRLPYCQDRIDYNPDIANISESILSKPFQNQNLPLRKGMHLHWTLPNALTQGGAAGTPDSFPAVPNRWLITKKTKDVVSQQWIIESDYLQEGPENYDGIPFPDFNPGQESPKPFKYLGRQLAFNGWKEDATAKRLPRLTAMGYGEPAFASFYPNCYRVFGCYDPDITTANLNGLSYQVIGWYSDLRQDPFLALKESDEFKKYLFTNINKTGDVTLDTGSIHDFFKNKLGWLIPLSNNDIAKLPAATYCYAQLDVEPGKVYYNERRLGQINLSIGNTGTEAMSAFLASEISAENGDKVNIEEQLECLLAYRALSSEQPDLGSRIKEARHEKGFKAEKGGHVWEIGPSQQKNNHSAENDKQEITIDFPLILADLLNTLNVQQQESDELISLLRYRKHILFADWYKYMICAYPADDDRDDYPDIDFVKNYIERTQLVEPPKVVEPAILPELTEQLQQFNDSDIAALLSVKFHKKNITPLPAGLVIDNIGDKWIENLPFSDYCLQFNKDSKDQVSVSGQNSEGIKAISAWINLAAKQGANATLLGTRNQGSLISNTAFAEGLNRVAINGKTMPDSRQPPWYLFPKEQWFHLYVEWEDRLAKDDIIYLFANNNTAFLQGKLASLRIFEQSISADELLCDMNILGHHHYTLAATAGPRYWQPAEPVIVLEGEAVKPSNRHGGAISLNDNNALACQIASVTNDPLQQTDLAILLTTISKGKPASGVEKPGFHTWTSQPWNPFLLEWQVEVYPMKEAGNLDTDDRDFDPEFITTNYHLPANNPDLSLTAGKGTISAATLYTGRSILTPHAKTRFIKGISSWFTHLKQEDCYQALIPPPNKKEKQEYDEQLTKWYNKKPEIPKKGPMPEDKVIFTNIYNWYLEKPVYNNPIQPFSAVFTTESSRIKDFNYTLIQAALKLAACDFLSQALSGFNNALLMHNQTLQLPVADPLGFPEYKAFTDKVKDAIAGNNNLAPLPYNDFLPIRTGTMRIQKLRIIDSFGQGKDISLNKFIKAESLSNEAFPDFTWLPPRFVPPARINFRWLSAGSDNQVMSTHPLDNPICGWIMTNHLDNSVMVYDREGHALGTIDQNAIWRTAPGSPVNYQVDDITDPHLRKIVQQLALPHDANEDDKKNKIAFLQYFITATDNALEHIHPESDIHHQEIALLMGKPMAVVRASISLQLKEGPPIHHGWNEFLQDLGRDTRDTNEFEKVKVPVRLGDRNQLNDGLVGYWIEDQQFNLGTVYYSTSSDGPEKQDGNPCLRLTLEKGSHKTLTLLVYPSGELHATTGMLPVKAINIPKEQYTPALKNINITFLSAPILTGKNQLAIPLPKEMGYEWSWLAKERFSWIEIAEIGVVRKDNAISNFTNGADIWEHLLQRGWLIEIDNNRASIVPIDQRQTPALEEPFNKQTETIQSWLDAGHIIPADTKAAFSDKQCIKEGWLKLKPNLFK